MKNSTIMVRCASVCSIYYHIRRNKGIHPECGIGQKIHKIRERDEVNCPMTPHRSGGRPIEKSSRQQPKPHPLRRVVKAKSVTQRIPVDISRIVHRRQLPAVRHCIHVVGITMRRVHPKGQRGWQQAQIVLPNHEVVMVRERQCVVYVAVELCVARIMAILAGIGVSHPHQRIHPPSLLSPPQSFL